MSLIPYTNEEDIKMLLCQYDEVGFQDLPEWLQDAMHKHSVTFERRNPTPQEMLETVEDAEEHRILNNERTIKDITKQWTQRKRVRNV